jgi:hypothetical protein
MIRPGRAGASLAMLLLSGCATAELTESGRLSSYKNLVPSDGVLTQSKVYIDGAAITAAHSVRLMPTVVDARAQQSGLTTQQLDLVSNAMDRSLCSNLSAKFVVVSNDTPADLVVQAIITGLSPTDTTAAGLSAVTGIGGKVISAASGVPLPIPRIPFGLGSLSTEAEARDSTGQQRAAIIWARGADALTTDARVAEEGDAHTLAARFAEDFAKLLVTGRDPMSDPTPMLPTAQGIGEYFGGRAKYQACEEFGRNPGLGDTLGSKIGLPPSWTDDGRTQR